jgi:hypothetical protein
MVAAGGGGGGAGGGGDGDGGVGRTGGRTVAAWPELSFEAPSAPAPVAWPRAFPGGVFASVALCAAAAAAAFGGRPSSCAPLPFFS